MSSCSKSIVAPAITIHTHTHTHIHYNTVAHSTCRCRCRLHHQNTTLSQQHCTPSLHMYMYHIITTHVSHHHYTCITSSLHMYHIITAYVSHHHYTTLHTFNELEASRVHNHFSTILLKYSAFKTTYIMSNSLEIVE